MKFDKYFIKALFDPFNIAIFSLFTFIILTIIMTYEASFKKNFLPAPVEFIVAAIWALIALIVFIYILNQFILRPIISFFKSVDKKAKEIRKNEK
ncbi:hypothetical protein OZX61_12800 (plasmid) [Acinetobacter sp. ESL0695]|uniref:hypothetical protein n=1 Tax=Acinetobacter sp. ESL0695 TaxID=2983215 RepID=UPI0023F57A10|nr:hypothetical protein [Acinetobacter sp. ESL0695]WEV50221.1 hypothetical protein OZX61_12800 [Acinetobacter sp. ESL0695]